MTLRFLYIAIVALAGCVVTDVGNPAIETEVEFAGHSGDAPPEPTALTLDSGIEIDEAFIKVRSFLLDDSLSCDNNANDFEGVVSVDLINNEIIGGGPLRLNRDAGEFCRLRLQFTNDDVDDALIQLEERSIYVKGSTSTGTPFEVVGDFEDELSLEGDFELVEGSHLLQVAFFLNEWIGEEDLVDNQTIDSAHPAYDTFRDNLATSARLFHDANKDGELDTEEIARSLAAGSRE